MDSNHGTIIGVCSICGGEVVRFSPIWSTKPIPAECKKCGATEHKKQPIIEMEKGSKVKKVILGSLNKAGNILKD